jgi:magnesium-transporting ATPase (P-type)
MVSAGQRVPGDCLVLESSDFKVDENIDEKFKLQKDEKGQAIKQNYELDYVSKCQRLNEENPIADPFVRADSLVTSGSAKLLVCCVGERSTRGKNSKKLEDDSVNTKLETTLRNLGSQFTFYSLIACIVIFINLLIMGIVASTADDGDDDASNNIGVGG